MTRLLINIFFIVIVCFTLSVMPINTEILEMFDFNHIFSSEDPEEEEEIVPVDEAFVPEYSAEVTINEKYNPTTMSIKLMTNIPEIYENNFDFKDLNMTLYQNEEVYVHVPYDKLVSNETISYNNDTLEIIYDLNIDFYNLGLNRDGFFDAEFYFSSDDKSDLIKEKYSIAYRPTIDYVDNGNAENNGNFIYKSFFLNEDETNLVPLYFSVKYPESITVEARNRLYDIAPLGSGLSDNPVLPLKTSVSKLGPGHYGVFMYSSEINKLIDTPERANLTVSAIVQTLTRLPHIDKLSLFVDEAQVEGSFFDVDLTKIYEQPIQSYAYLTEVTSTTKRYLVPVPVSEANIYDEVWSIFSLLQSGQTDEKAWTQILPPDIVVNNFIIEGTTITVDFNDAILSAYENDEEYKKLMVNSILYSLTSIENINKVSITVDGEPVTTLAGYDFTEPLLAPPYINYIGEF